jgi:Ca2+:H+ antiporter
VTHPCPPVQERRPLTETARRFGPFSFEDVRLFAIGTVLCLFAALTRFVSLGDVTAFVAAGIAIAVLAVLVGVAVDQIADRLGAGATGVLQSALGNLPELFIGIFALRQGLITVVQAAVVGSILANLLLVLGLSFVVGGLKNGRQRFSSDRARMITVSMVLAVAALVVPSLALTRRLPPRLGRGGRSRSPSRCWR